jgi:hypothetical protein
MTSGVFLSFSALSTFNPATQAEIADFIKAQVSPDLAQEVGAPAADVGEEPADLSVAQANTFLKRVSDKVRNTMRVIAEADASGFAMSAVGDALGVDLETADLRGVWGGITKRVRTVLGDDEAVLIWWTQDEQGEWTGRVSAYTHRSLRKAFGL